MKRALLIMQMNVSLAGLATHRVCHRLTLVSHLLVHFNKPCLLLLYRAGIDWQRWQRPRGHTVDQRISCRRQVTVITTRL